MKRWGRHQWGVWKNEWKETHRKAGSPCQKTFHTLKTHLCFPLLGPQDLGRCQAVQEECLGREWGNQGLR